MPLMLGSAISLIVREVVQAAVRNPEVPLESPRPATAAVEVAAEVVDRVKALPEIQHVTNTEPWWQSRVTIGALVSGLAGFAGLFGIVISPEDAEIIVGVVIAAGSIIGALTTLYGRWIARKPLGA